MKSTNALRIAQLTLAGIAGLFLATPLQAEVHSKSGDLVVVQPQNLPEQARMPGNSLFLYDDNEGDTYLYVEQQQGALLRVFDVTDPSRIKLVASQPLTVPEAFDFVRPLNGNAAFIRFHDNKGVAVLDLRKPKAPALKAVNAFSASGSPEALGASGFLLADEPRNYTGVVPRDYEVVDTSAPSDPALLATVKQVTSKVVNCDTGTTFLLGSSGLTVVRRIRVEKEHKIELMQQVN